MVDVGVPARWPPEKQYPTKRGRPPSIRQLVADEQAAALAKRVRTHIPATWSGAPLLRGPSKIPVVPSPPVQKPQARAQARQQQAATRLPTPAPVHTARARKGVAGAVAAGGRNGVGSCAVAAPRPPASPKARAQQDGITPRSSRRTSSAPLPAFTPRKQVASPRRACEESARREGVIPSVNDGPTASSLGTPTVGVPSPKADQGPRLQPQQDALPGKSCIREMAGTVNPLFSESPDVYPVTEDRWGAAGQSTIWHKDMTILSLLVLFF
ncbi:unnamed protein product [Ostreobium quekettii]|uniref:Uncharacterized protein n=1 Tax=Ostreobium quekettii TaxID=121088 RepID=A0A8S1JES9_9CHLO|nr:unnamed protein product [Ostreobium quekettii]